MKTKNSDNRNFSKINLDEINLDEINIDEIAIYTDQINSKQSKTDEIEKMAKKATKKAIKDAKRAEKAKEKMAKKATKKAIKDAKRAEKAKIDANLSKQIQAQVQASNLVSKNIYLYFDSYNRYICSNFKPNSINGYLQSSGNVVIQQSGENEREFMRRAYTELGRTDLLEALNTSPKSFRCC